MYLVYFFIAIFHYLRIKGLTQLIMQLLTPTPHMSIPLLCFHIFLVTLNFAFGLCDLWLSCFVNL